MKKTLSVICSAALLLTLAGCDKKDSLTDDGTSAPHGDEKISSAVSESSAASVESAAPTPSDITLQKIPELRNELETQINTVKNAGYNNMHTTEDFVARIPDADILYDLTLTAPKPDFKTWYEKFDKTFDKEFAGIYTQEDKKKLYCFCNAEFSKEPLEDHFDELMSGEMKFWEIYVDTEKAYFVMSKVGNGIHWLYHDGTIRRAKPDEEPKSVALTSASKYFDIVKNYLDVDSEDKYALIDKEVSIKEAVETVKKITAENEYSWGGSLEPDVYQVKVLDIGEGKYGLSFTMTPSYKGVMFDTFESSDDRGMSTYRSKLDHDYIFLAPNAFMMENGKLDSFTGGMSEYSAVENAEYDSVIPLDKAAQMLSESVGPGMNLSLSRVELLYSSMYDVNENDNTVSAAFPVWKFRCHNSVDDYKYIFYINAVNGNLEYYTTDWWEV